MVNHKKKVGKACQITIITSIILNVPYPAVNVLPEMWVLQAHGVLQDRRGSRGLPGPPEFRGLRPDRATGNSGGDRSYWSYRRYWSHRCHGSHRRHRADRTHWSEWCHGAYRAHRSAGPTGSTGSQGQQDLPVLPVLLEPPALLVLPALRAQCLMILLLLLQIIRCSLLRTTLLLCFRI